MCNQVWIGRKGKCIILFLGILVGPVETCRIKEAVGLKNVKSKSHCINVLKCYSHLNTLPLVVYQL